VIKEIDLFGVFLPPLLAYAALAALIWRALRMVLERAGFYGLVWHPALFNLSAFVGILAAVVAALK
jgi:protein AaeX